MKVTPRVFSGRFFDNDYFYWYRESQKEKKEMLEDDKLYLEYAEIVVHEGYSSGYV